MSEISEETRTAIDIFLSKIIDHAYNGAIIGIRKILEKGPSGRAKQVKKNMIYNWYQKLTQ